jgi:hypothetical protein
VPVLVLVLVLLALLVLVLMLVLVLLVLPWIWLTACLLRPAGLITATLRLATQTLLAVHRR